MFNENLRYLRRHARLSQEKLAEKLGTRRSTYRDYENGVAEPNITFLKKISDFFNISLDDLLRNDLHSLDKKNTSNQNLQNIRNNNLRVLTVSVDNQQNENIEFVSHKAKAGYLSGFADPEFIQDLQKFKIPSLNQGTYRAFEISGDSMPPMVQGTIVIGRYVENQEDIKDNHTYVLITRSEGMVYKRVKNNINKDGTLLLISDNPVYEPYQLPAEDIMEAWAYYAHISFKPYQEFQYNPLNDVMDKLKTIGKQVNDIQNRIE